MSVDVLVGLQYGSEGKGAWAGRMARCYQASVRVGAPNAGHTVWHEGKPYKMRQIPCAWVNPECELFVGAGGMINVALLDKELCMLPGNMKVPQRLHIDSHAGVLDEADRQSEEGQQFNEFNGSTAEGCGVALSRKILRKDGHIAGADKDLALSAYVTDTRHALWELDGSGQDILLEGTQGYGLCLNHGTYPFVTSRDVLASSILSDCGLAPSACNKVFGVMRTYPIRVAGNSGPMGAQELDWETVAQRAGFPPGHIEERTTVTNRVRRVSEMNWSMLQEACLANEPDGIFISFIDYLDSRLHCRRTLDDLRQSPAAMQFIEKVGEYSEVVAVSTGPKPEDMIPLQAWNRYFRLAQREAA